MKKIVTHINPDLDAVCGVWLIKRFLPGWEEAEVGFCPAESTFENQPVDSNPEVLHVDVGLGKLDHHQTSQYLSATKLVFDYLKSQRERESLSPLDEQALQIIVKVVTEIDNARDLNWQEVKEGRYDFYLSSILAGIRGLAGSDLEVVNYGMRGMEAVFHNLKGRIRAKEELKEGIEFTTSWGKALALNSGNEFVLWEGEKTGYCLVVRKDPQNGGVRIYARADSKVDLKNAYNKFKEMDPESEWFLHSSGKLLLNESRVKEMKPTKLSLEEIVEVLKKAN